MKSFSIDLEGKKEDVKMVQIRIKTAVINKLDSIAPKGLSHNRKIRHIIEAMVESGVQINFENYMKKK